MKTEASATPYKLGLVDPRSLVCILLLLSVQYRQKYLTSEAILKSDLPLIYMAIVLLFQPADWLIYIG